MPPLRTMRRDGFPLRLAFVALLLAVGAAGARLVEEGAAARCGDTAGAGGASQWRVPRWAHQRRRRARAPLRWRRWARPRPPSDLRRMFDAGVPLEVSQLVLQYMPWPAQVAVSSGQIVRLWRVGAQAPRRVLSAHRAHVVDVKFFPAGDRLATAGLDGAILVWGAATGDVLRELRGLDEAHEAQVFPQGDRVAAIGSGSAVIWDAATGELLHRLGHRGAAPGRIRVYPRGERLVTARLGLAMIWDAASGAALRRLRQSQDLGHVEVSPGGERLATVGGRSVWVWNATDGRLERTLASRSYAPRGVAFVAGGAKLVTAAGCGVHIWDIRSGMSSRLSAGSVHAIFSLGWRPLAVDHDGVRATMWNTTAGERLHALSGPDNIEHLAVGARGDVVAVCAHSLLVGGGQSVAVWDVATGRLLQAMEGRSGADSSACRVAVGYGGWTVLDG